MSNLKLGVSVVALTSAIGLSAWGQTQTAQSAPATATELETVVVTAEKQATNLQKTARSITAIGGQKAADEGRNNLTEMLRDVAGLQITGTGASGQGSQFFIRGVGFSPAFGQDSAISMNINGVFQQRAQSTRATFYDIARVEVVRGPDATLNGRNALGGSVNVITNEPRLKSESSATIDGGNYGLIAGQAMVNIPVNDKIAVRAAFAAEKRDGYLSNGANDSDVFGGRLRALFLPTDNLKVIISGDYAKTAGVGSQQAHTGIFDSTGPIKITQGFDYNPQPTNSSKTYNVSNLYADITYDLGWADLYFQPTVHRSDYDNNTTNFSPLTYYTRTLQGYNAAAATALATTGMKERSYQKQTTMELRLSSPRDSKIRWLGGLYYFLNKEGTVVNQATGTTTPTATASPTPAVAAASVGSLPIVPDATFTPLSPARQTKDYAAFGQIVYPITDTVRVNVGGRYTSESKARNAATGSATSNTLQAYRLDDGIANSVSGGRVYYTIDARSGKWSSADFKASLEKDLAPDSMLYLTVSTGFKSGGFVNLPSSFVKPGFRTTYDPEHLKSYEIGSKNEFFNRRMRLNIGAFFYDYQDYQFNYAAYAFNYPGGDPDQTTTVIANAASARSYGSELESALLLTERDRLSLNVSYLHARFKKVVLNNANAESAALAAGLEGEPLSRSPEWTFMPGYDHTFVLSKGTMVASVKANIQSSMTITLPNTTASLNHPYRYFRQPGFTKVDASIGYNSADGLWGVTAYVRNLTNEKTFDSLTLPTTYSTANDVSFEPSPPRVFGVTLTARR